MKPFIQAWSVKTPWPDSRQVEQDLIISCALCDIFNAPSLKLSQYVLELATGDHCLQIIGTSH